MTRVLAQIHAQIYATLANKMTNQAHATVPNQRAPKPTAPNPMSTRRLHAHPHRFHATKQILALHPHRILMNLTDVALNTVQIFLAAQQTTTNQLNY